MGAIEAVGDSDRQPPSRYSWNDGIPRADVEPWKEVESKFEAIFLVRALRENSCKCLYWDNASDLRARYGVIYSG